jgi:lipopolysaccharide heptosyltransferase II
MVSNSEISVKILIIRLSSIGDIVLTSPLIQLLRQKYPESTIDFVVKKALLDLVAHNPAIEHIYIFDKSQGFKQLRDFKKQIRLAKYDLIIDIHKNFRSLYLRTGSSARRIVKYKKYPFRRWLLVQLKINLFREVIPIAQRYITSLPEFRHIKKSPELNFQIPGEVKKQVSEKWSIAADKPIYGMAPGASFKTKRWTVEGFIAIARYIIDHLNGAIILFGNERDLAITSQITAKVSGEIIDSAGKCSLLETAALLDQCELIITNDTGLMHIATALDKKVVAIFGSTTKELGFFPYSNKAVVVENNDLKCRPCSHVGRHECPKKHFRCMKDISMDQVVESIKSFGD